MAPFDGAAASSISWHHLMQPHKDLFVLQTDKEAHLLQLFSVVTFLPLKKFNIASLWEDKDRDPLKVCVPFRILNAWQQSFVS